MSDLCPTCEGKGTVDASIHAQHVTIRQAEVCPDCRPAPSPYRFTVSVEDVSGFDYEKWEVRLKRSAMNGTRAANYYLGFCATEAEARSRAALVLAALHQATLEGDKL